MKVRLLSCFLFILYIQSVTVIGFESFPTSKAEDFDISTFHRQLQVRETGVNITNGLSARTERQEMKGKQEIFDSVKGQKGKGTYGGNDVHHPRSNKGAASITASPCYLISAAMLHVSFGLMGLLLPYFLTGY